MPKTFPFSSLYIIVPSLTGVGVGTLNNPLYGLEVVSFTVTVGVNVISLPNSTVAEEIPKETTVSTGSLVLALTVNVLVPLLPAYV